MFWNQVKKKRKKKRKRESWRKKERMRAGFTGMFLNGGEKENKRRGWGDRDRTLDTCVEEKNKKKRNETHG